jgi:hypothetical protein
MPNGDPDPPNEYYLHRYRVTDVPEGCTNYQSGDFVNMWVPEPPDKTAMLMPGDGCDGLMVELDDPQ